jgi:hypothetical protein
MGRAKDVIRVGVVEEGRPLSGIWRIWRNGDDIYVAPRSVAGSFKISLHASGKFRFGFVSDAKARRFLPEDNDRAVFKWQGRTPTPDAPLSVLVQIVFPASDLLAPNHTPVLHKALVNLRTPQVSEGVVISIIETVLPPNVVEICAETYVTRTLAKWDLPNGHQIWVTEHTEVLGEEFVERLKEFRNSIPARRSEIKGELPDRRTSNLRAFASFHKPDGIVRFVDVSAEHVRSTDPIASGVNN